MNLDPEYARPRPRTKSQESARAAMRTRTAFHSMLNSTWRVHRRDLARNASGQPFSSPAAICQSQRAMHGRTTGQKVDLPARRRGGLTAAQGCANRVSGQ